MSAPVKRNGHDTKHPVLRVVIDPPSSNTPNTYYVDKLGVEHFNMLPFIAQLNRA